MTSERCDVTREAQVKRIRVVAAVIERDGRLLVCQRAAHKRHGGLWEFPGGKLEDGEDDRAALERELREELLVEVIEVGRELFSNDDDGSAFTIAFIPTTISGEPRPIEHQAIRWVNWRDAADIELAPSDRRFVQHVMERQADTAGG